MKILNLIKQSNNVGGTLVTGLLSNGLLIGFCKDEQYYHLFVDDKYHQHYTKSIFDRLNTKYNNLEMTYGSFFPPKIKIEHKHFKKFVNLLENMSIDKLQPDPFSG